VKAAIKDLAASVRERLHQLSIREHVEFQQILNRYVVERVLCRLSRSDYARDFILKGATLFTLWENLPHRRTRDMDFLGFGENSAGELRRKFEGILATPVPADGLAFGKLAVAPIREDQAYGGLRVTTQASLGRAVIPLTIDVGFGDDAVPPPTIEEFPTLLGDPKPCIRVYAVETVVAEKLEAMVTLGLANSRMKDFFDLWHLASFRAFDGARLAAAVQATFQRRKTPVPDGDPLALTVSFSEDPAKLAQWTAFCRRNITQQVPPGFPQVIEHLRRFLLPLLASIRSQTACSGKWAAGGPWR
jgi:predicted nucleotidyltransferase component of viral defense system